jgi:hypothetical protein
MTISGYFISIYGFLIILMAIGGYFISYYWLLLY